MSGFRYPAFAVDAHWNLIAANPAMGLFLDGVATSSPRTTRERHPAQPPPGRPRTKDRQLPRVRSAHPRAAPTPHRKPPAPKLDETSRRVRPPRSRPSAHTTQPGWRSPSNLPSATAPQSGSSPPSPHSAHHSTSASPNSPSKRFTPPTPQAKPGSTATRNHNTRVGGHVASRQIRTRRDDPPSRGWALGVLTVPPSQARDAQRRVRWRHELFDRTVTPIEVGWCQKKDVTVVDFCDHNRGLSCCGVAYLPRLIVAVERVERYRQTRSTRRPLATLPDRPVGDIA